ncbi:hypothetical protein LSAT2_009847 [Lamellibrachia satsuma]|nr:hypothetical protein LSAT2_009847 [Lamellibrachia satsuma]
MSCYGSLYWCTDDEDSETDEQVHILMKNEDSHWMHCNDIEFKVVRDSVWIDLDEFSSRIIVLRVSCVVTTGELLKMVANLEHQLSERAISMVVRQREDDMAAVHIECCPTNKVSRLLDTLAAEGYTYGPESKFSFYVRDGDRLEITFRGNLCFDDDDSFRFVYNSGVKAIPDTSQSCYPCQRIVTKYRLLSSCAEVVAKGASTLVSYVLSHSGILCSFALGRLQSPSRLVLRCQPMVAQIFQVCTFSPSNLLSSKQERIEGAFLLNPVSTLNQSTSRRDTFVKEVDRFAQHGLDYYRGHVQLMRLTGSTPGSGTQDGRGRQMLCEQPLTLPKCKYEFAWSVFCQPPMEPTVVVRAPVKVEETGPLTFGYFRELSEYIGDEWQQLAERLGIKRARIQSLMRSNPKVGSRPKNIEDMLLQWYKRCPKRHDKVADLYYSLCEVGREDLAVELRERNNEFLERADNIAEDDRLKRAVKAVIGSAHAWREWTSVARELGLTERQIADIERDNPGPDRRRDCCYQTLLAWQEIHGERATRKQLLRAMKRLRFKDVAGEDITMGDSDCV